jgi:hypothetical protein
MSAERESQKGNAWFALIPFLLFISALGVRGLGLDAIWYDEYWSIYYAGGAHYGPISLAETWTRVASSDAILAYGDQESNPPGYYLLLNIWGSLVGWSPEMARTLSLLLGVLAVAWIYRLGRDVISAAGGVGAVITLGASAFFIFYLHEARSYTLFILLTVIMLWGYWRGVLRWNRGDGSAPRPYNMSRNILLIQAAFVLSAAGLFYTHYLAGLTAISLGIYHVLFAPKDERWWRGLALFALAALLVTPVLPLALTVAGRASSGDTLQQFALPTDELLESLAMRFSNGLTAILLILLFWYALRMRGRSAEFVWFLALTTLFGMLAFNLVFPVVTHIRYVMGLWPLLALGVGLSAAYLYRSSFQLTPIYIAWILTCLLYTFDPERGGRINDAYYYLPWPQAVEALETKALPDDSLIFLLPEFPSRPRMHRPVADYYLHDLSARYELTEPPELDNPAGYLEHVSNEVMGERARLWLAFDPQQEPANSDDFRELLDAQLIQCESVVDTDTLQLALYARRPPREAVGYRFGGGSIRLFPLGAPPTLKNGTLMLLQGWRIARSVPPNTYSVALHILGQNDTLVAQADYPLPETGFHCLPAQVDVSQLMPGTYRLVTRVYAWETGERLRLSVSGSDGATLGAFTVMSHE